MLDPEVDIGHTVDVDGVTAKLPALRCILPVPGQRIGWFQRSQDDCLRAAVATCTQVAYENVPNLTPENCDDHTKAAEMTVWFRLFQWASEWGLEIEFHDGPSGCEWSIGMGAPTGEHGSEKRGLGHTLVLYRDQPCFQPDSGFRLPDGYALAPVTEVTYSMSFHAKGEPDA